MGRSTRPLLGQLLRFGALLGLSLLALQLYFLLRIALMGLLDPQSTSFQRSEIWRLATEQQQVLWSQSWRDYAATSVHLKRAVMYWVRVDKIRRRSPDAPATIRAITAPMKVQ